MEEESINSSIRNANSQRECSMIQFSEQAKTMVNKKKNVYQSMEKVFKNKRQQRIRISPCFI